MRPETRIKILKEILEIFYHSVESGKPVSKSDFRELQHNKCHIQQVRMELKDAGIIEQKGRDFVLCEGIFERRDRMLENVRAIRNGTQMEMEFATKDLLRVFSAKEAFKAKNFEEFLQTYNLQALTHGKEVVEVTHVFELWTLFVEILNNVQKFSWLLNDLTDIIWNAIMLVKDSKQTNVMRRQIDGKTLNEILVAGVRRAIFDLAYFEAYPMYEPVEIKLFFILRELDSENDALVKVVMDLLSRPVKRIDFSKMAQPVSDDEDASGKLMLPDIWHTSQGYSRLFKAVYGLLENMKNKSLRNLLREWTASKDTNLKWGAYIFLDYSFRKNKL